MVYMDFFYKETAQVNTNEIQAETNRVFPYLEYLEKVAKENDYEYDESSINLPFDENNLNEIIKLQKQITNPQLKYIIDIGIGGSNLGAKAVYDALYGFFDLIEPLRYPKVIFADTNDPAFIYKLERFLRTHIYDPQELLINAVSKSGSTTETIVNLEILISKLPYAKDRLVVTTGFGSELWHTSKEMGIECLDIPKKVGGRFSVLSNVGLFPLGCVGLNIVELLNGAKAARKYGLERDVFKNPSLLSAIIAYVNYKKGKTINTTFLFHPELESLGKWYQQLMGESIGKDGQGITPTVAIGSTDLHSMGQLYLGGIKDKLFTFVTTLGHDEEVRVPKDPEIEVLSTVQDKSAKEVMHAILEGVKIAYKNKGLPFAEVRLKDISERSMGEFMQYKMLEMMYLGKLLGVNTFDQPNVDEYKKETKRILAHS